MAHRPFRLAPLAIAGAFVALAGPCLARESITANTFDDRDLNPAVRADLNRDGAINDRDVRLFLDTRKAGSSGTIVTDINADGELDATDLSAMLDMIGKGVRPPPPSATATDDSQSYIARKGLSRMVSQG